MEVEKNAKLERVLRIYTRLMNGETLNKSELANDFGVNEKSIQRDIEEIRNFLDCQMAENGFENSVIYDREKKGYRLEQIYKLKLTNSEVLAICKILLDSRSLTKPEMTEILDKLIDCCVPKVNQKTVTDLILNEKEHYIEPQHKRVFIDMMWDIGQAIQTARYIEIDYQKSKYNNIVTRKLKPLAIMFSEYYFYLTAFLENYKSEKYFANPEDPFPTIYRIDRIRELRVLDEHYHVPYGNRFEEGEFRKRIQFMQGGRLRKLKFKYKGDSIEAILDRLPTAKIISENDGVYTLTAEVFGNGIDMWLASQGDRIEVIE
ncbi:MAG: helix-turn-helix transcriptional regulator [Lachnospiraceae bacterium]